MPTTARFRPSPIRLACLLLLPAALGARVDAADDFYLKDGDRVVFYGDSITEQRLYTAYVETYAATRFPDRRIAFVHSGWSGDRVTGGGGGPIDLRLERDVIAHRPTVVTIMLGMNDGRYRPFDEEVFREYSEGYAHIVARLKAELPGVRLTLIKPSPYDDVTRDPNFEGGYNAVLVRFGAFIETLAAEHGATVADLNAPVVEATRKAAEVDRDLAAKLNPDRVHPAPAGQLLMAAALLDAWKAPALVTQVAIDADGGDVATQENTRVEKVYGFEKIAWTQTDAALPFPVDRSDPATALAVKVSGFDDALNRQILRVSGEVFNLAAEYDLSIDGQSVGTFTGMQFADGLNLATLDTPMTRQAAEVHDLTRKHNNIHFTRWRQVQVPFDSESDSARYASVLEALDALEAEVVEKQREAAQPKPRRYELTRRRR